MDIQRKEFEAWLFQTEKFKNRNKSFLFMLDENGNYEDIPVFEHWQTWRAAKAQAVQDTYTPIVLALEDVQSKIAKTSFLTMDEENENEVMAVNANELAAYIDELIEAQEQDQ